MVLVWRFVWFSVCGFFAKQTELLYMLTLATFFLKCEKLCNYCVKTAY